MYSRILVINQNDWYICSNGDDSLPHLKFVIIERETEATVKWNPSVWRQMFQSFDILAQFSV